MLTMLAKSSLQTRIFGLFVILLVLVQSVSFWSTYQANRQLESQKLADQLNKAKSIFSERFDTRSYYLSAFSETASKDFGLKDNLEGDNRSFLIALNNHKKRIDANIAMAISIDGKIIGQLVTHPSEGSNQKTIRGAEHGQDFRYPEWLEFPEENRFYNLSGAIYQLRLAPILNGSTAIGWVGFGYVINEQLANEFLNLTGFNAGFVFKKNNTPVVLALSNQDVTAVERSLIENLIINNVGLNEYISFKQEIGELDDSKLYAVMYKSREDALSTLERSWLRLVLLILVSLTLSMLGAYAVAKSISKPIQQLIAQAQFIAKGNYESKVSVGNSKELNQLADEFTQMQHAVLTREKAIAHRAYHDALTNLPNRNQLMLTLEKAMEVSNTPFYLLLLNVRRIKEVNDTLGHHVGDEVIKETANRLSTIEGMDLLCHISGDEFVFIKANCSPAELKSTVAHIIETIESPYCYQNISLHLQASIGIANSSLTNNANLLLQKADAAANESKKKKLPYFEYDKELDNYSVERLQLVNQLKSAITSNELVLFYQPKLDLKSKKVTHVEALVRWQHPETGMIPPDQFISIAENTGQMNALTMWVLNEAAKQYKSWQRQGINLSIAVNISAENLKDKSFSDQVLSLISSQDLPLDALLLEITEESVVDDTNLAIEILSYLRGHGLKISIDDYGTGYSSLAQLKKLPVHELKIDKAFVQHLMSDKDDQTIVESTIRLAHNMGLTVVAEGVEDEDTLHWLAENHCEMAQGYFISRPLPAHELNVWLQKTEFFQHGAISHLKGI